MPSEDSLRRLACSVTPSQEYRSVVASRIQQRIAAPALVSLVKNVQPDPGFAASAKTRILGAITYHGVPIVHAGLKWTAAFAVFVLLLRSMPLLLVAPATHADVGVQLVPAGENVSVYVGGVWRTMVGAEVVRGPIMVSTNDSTATLILNDDGVLRLGPHTTLKLHDIGDRPQVHAEGPVATLIRGDVWALGLLPPIVESLILETSQGTLSLNAGSASVTDEDGVLTVAVYDKGVTLESGKQTSFLVSGEKAVVREGRPFSIVTMPKAAFADARVASNLSQDAVHRSDIARLQEERRVTMAGILPTSFLYPAKLIAEEVDVLFTLTGDGRTEKRMQQANTRFSEALALMKDGQNAEANTSLVAYKKSLLSLASDENDNLVKYLIQKQVADASASFSNPSDGTGSSVVLLKEAIAQVGAVIPDTDLNPKDIEGYVLVDKLAEISRMLAVENDPAAAARNYSDIQPYLSALLDEESGAHPLLQKEAKALLVSASSRVKEAMKTSTDEVLTGMAMDMAQYLPVEQTQILVSEEELNARIGRMMKRMYVFRHPTSRYNQLLAEMREIENDPNRGTLLRRLKAALPEGLGGYVNTEIQELRDELGR